MAGWICEDCGSEVIGKVRRGRCEKCYRKHLKHLRETGQIAAATPRPHRPSRPQSKPTPKLTLAERVFKKTTPGWGGCILFTGNVDRDGYARLRVGHSQKRILRRVYQEVVGAIPDGMVLDHLCHSEDAACLGGNTCIHRRCVNPRHLEPVSLADNNLRGLSLSAKNFFKTACKRGHEFTPENTIQSKRLRTDGKPRRTCRICLQKAQQEWLARNRKKAA